MSSLNEKIYEHLKEMAREDCTLQEILDYLITEQKLDHKSRIAFIQYLKEAFNLNMKDAMKIGAWDYFDDGTRSIEALELEIRPLIEDAMKNI